MGSSSTSSSQYSSTSASPYVNTATACRQNNAEERLECLERLYLGASEPHIRAEHGDRPYRVSLRHAAANSSSTAPSPILVSNSPTVSTAEAAIVGGRH